MSKRRASILVVALMLIATTQVAASEHRRGDPRVDEQAAAEMTAAVLGDELTPKTHPRTLGLYWDHDFGGYAVVIPDAGDVPGPEAFGEFGIPYRYQTSSLTPERLAEIEAGARGLMERLSRDEGHPLWGYYDARRDMYRVEGTAPRSAFEELLTAHRDHLRYRRVAPSDGWRRSDSTMEVEDTVADLYNFVDGPLDGPAVADLTGLALAIDGDELVVRFDTAGGWDADLTRSFTRASYMLHVAWDGPGAGSISVDVSLEDGRWTATGWAWPEPVPLDGVTVSDGGVIVRVPLSVLGPPDDLMFVARSSKPPSRPSKPACVRCVRHPPRRGLAGPAHPASAAGRSRSRG